MLPSGTQAHTAGPSRSPRSWIFAKTNYVFSRIDLVSHQRGRCYSSCATYRINMWQESFPLPSTWAELKSSLPDRLIPSNCVEESALRLHSLRQEHAYALHLLAQGEEHTSGRVRRVLGGGDLDARHFKRRRALERTCSTCS